MNTRFDIIDGPNISTLFGPNQFVCIGTKNSLFFKIGYSYLPKGSENRRYEYERKITGIRLIVIKYDSKKARFLIKGYGNGNLNPFRSRNQRHRFKATYDAKNHKGTIVFD